MGRRAGTELHNLKLQNAHPPDSGHISFPSLGSVSSDVAVIAFFSVAITFPLCQPHDGQEEISLGGTAGGTCPRRTGSAHRQSARTRAAISTDGGESRRAESVVSSDCAPAGHAQTSNDDVSASGMNRLSDA